MIQPVKPEHRFENVMIIGGGESLRGVDLSGIKDFNGAIISVNYVIQHLPRCDFWMTVDPASKGIPILDRMERNPETYYYTAQPDLEKEKWHRGFYPIHDYVHYLERIVPEKDYSLQEDKTKITTGDSMYGALGLAYHFEPKRIFILGLDIYGKGHWYDLDYPYNLGWGSDWYAYKQRVVNIFAQSAPQLEKKGIEVWNGSAFSKVDVFPRITPEECLKKALN